MVAILLEADKNLSHSEIANLEYLYSEDGEGSAFSQFFKLILLIGSEATA